MQCCTSNLYLRLRNGGSKEDCIKQPLSKIGLFLVIFTYLKLFIIFAGILAGIDTFIMCIMCMII